MNLKECIEKVGGSYNEIMGRMLTEARVKKFLLMFIEDQSFNELCEAMGRKDYELAFRAAHTLKGVCANIGVENLRVKADAITEALRGNVNNGADELLPAVVEEYNNVIECINNLE